VKSIFYTVSTTAVSPSRKGDLAKEADQEGNLWCTQTVSL